MRGILRSGRAPEDGYRRRSARILLLDGSGRLLMFRFPRSFDRPDMGHCWITPGGGVDEGEELAAAAARELREETGLVVTPEELGSRVAVTSGYADLGWSRGVFRDDFFLHRVAGAYEVDTSGQEEKERAQITAHRWWTLEELAATGEVVYPFGLVPLLTELLAGRVPAEPVRLPWHH
ncbi:NUDIX domain-containing protein [Actinomadura viridis]|uniref:NUDIX domain-containing protein n=1 Tax=Actinomadura viridis TaxID=58110 RepID=UPI00368B53C6